MNLTANYPTDVDIKEKLYGSEFIRSRNMKTLDINDTNMEFKQIITIINEIPNDVTNINSKVIKQGEMYFLVILACFSKVSTTPSLRTVL